MSKKQGNNLIVWGLAFLTLLSLIISLQAIHIGIVTERLVELIVYAAITAFALILSVPLSRKELSIAHAIGMMAFLSLPADVIPAMTIALFIGGLVGASGRKAFRSNRYEKKQASFYEAIHISARVTLPYFVAAYLYNDVFKGALPINSATDFGLQLLPLLSFALIYVGLYFASFVLQIMGESETWRRIVAENGLALLVILFLPVPYAYMGASVAQMDESPVLFVITMTGALLIIFGLYVLNRSQQLLRRQLDELHSISVATQTMRGNLNLEALLKTIYIQVSQLLDTQNFTVVLREEADERVSFPLVIRGGEELEVKDSHVLPDDYGLIEHIMKTGTSLLIDDDVANRAKEIGVRAPQKPILSWLGVPVMVNDKAMGAFVMQSYEQRNFDENDLRVLNIIVSSAGIAIENARLYQQISIHAEQLATLNRITVLLTESLAPDEVMEIVVSSATTISDASAVGIFLFDEHKTDELKLAYYAGLSDAFRHKPPMPLLSKQLITTQDDYTKPNPILAPNLDYAATNTTDLTHKRLLDEGKRAFIEHPLSMGGKNLGVLVLYFDKPQIFHPEQVDLIQAFVTQAAQAITNARRFESANKTLEKRIEQLYVLAAMGRQLLNASAEAEQIYSVVLNYATDATKASRGLIAIYQEKQLKVVSQREYPADMFANASLLEQGLTGQVLKTGQALRIEDTRQSTGYLPLVPKTRSMLISPIMKGSQVLGLIVLEDDKPRAFSEGDAQFISQINNQAVIGIDNTILFEGIREARDNMQVMLNAMEEGIIMIDHQREIALANPRVSLLQLSAADIIHQPIKGLLDNSILDFAQKLGFSSQEAILKLLERLEGDWESYAPYDFEVNGKDGVRYIQRQIIPVHDGRSKTNSILLVYYDKTQEHELAAARDSFSQMIVHDLRSPLTAVTTSLRLLEELVPKESDFAKVVEKTTDTSRRALRKVLNRVSSLLDISKIESGEINLEREPTDVSNLVESVRNELKPLADELGIKIAYEQNGDLPLLDIDADKVERVLLNLVDNALKYSPEDSTVMIQVAKADLDYLRLEIIDHGPGIPDDYKKRLFDRYVQIEGRKTVRHGVGLGLAFCKLVTEAHGGDIWVADNPDGGSIFKLMLPIAKLPELVE